MSSNINKRTVPVNNLSNRKKLVAEVVKHWNNDQILSYVNSSLERWYRESKIDFELDWTKEIIKDDP